MDDIILNIDPSVWNVLKFVILTIITTPVLELMFQRLINTKATYDVLLGKKLLLCDSQLGLFSLHATHWGSRKNRYLLLLIGIPILTAELLFEFSFSVDTVDVPAEQRVWLPPSHKAHYTVSESQKLGSSLIEPTQFPIEATDSCIQGPSEMIRSGSATQTVDEYLSGFEYHMEGEYVIRKPYLALDNSSILCSKAKTAGPVNFVVPHVVMVKGSTKAEGLYAQRNTTDSESLRRAFTNGSFEYVGRLDTAYFSGAVRENGQAVCIRPRDHGFHCALYFENSFILTNSSLFWTKAAFENFTMSVVLKATGAPIEGLKNRERRIRLLATLLGSELLRPRLGGRTPSQLLIGKDKLERIALLTLVVANEEGVGGFREQVGIRSLLKEEKQTATMKRIAFIPIGVLLFFMFVFIIGDGVLSLLIIYTSSYKVAKVSSWNKFPHRVRTSIQWLRGRICDDLLHDGTFEDITSEDISLKATPEIFQMLPKMPYSHQQ